MYAMTTKARNDHYPGYDEIDHYRRVTWKRGLEPDLLRQNRERDEIHGRLHKTERTLSRLEIEMDQLKVKYCAERSLVAKLLSQIVELERRLRELENDSRIYMRRDGVKFGHHRVNQVDYLADDPRRKTNEINELENTLRDIKEQCEREKNLLQVEIDRLYIRLQQVTQEKHHSGKQNRDPLQSQVYSNLDSSKTDDHVRKTEEIYALKTELQNMKEQSKEEKERLHREIDRLSVLLRQVTREKDLAVNRYRDSIKTPVLSNEEMFAQRNHNTFPGRSKRTKNGLAGNDRHNKDEDTYGRTLTPLETKQRRRENDDEIDKLQKRNEMLERKLQEETNRHRDELVTLRHDRNDEVKKLQKLNERLERKLLEEKSIHRDELVNQRIEYEKRLNEISMRRDDARRQRVEATSTDRTFEQMRKELADTKAELDDVRNRLSHVMSSQLTDNNPNIADLSDKNRPTKLAERYSELYDNQWTDAYELVNSGDSLKAVMLLRRILEDTMEYCLIESSAQMKRIKKALLMTESAACPDRVIKQLKDSRKATANISSAYLYKGYLESIKRSDKPYSRVVDRIESYIRECFELCWFMSVQDPPVILSEIVQPGSSFNTDIYRAYTQTGKRVEYVVWPALLLHQGGPVLSKGVAQGRNT